jgi:hypothetical protein
MKPQLDERDGEIRFSRLHITRSIPDRVLLGLLGTLGIVLFGTPLYFCITYNIPNDWVIRLGRLFVEEVLITMLVLSLSCLIWCAAAPRWLERGFKRQLRRMVMIFVAMFLLLALGIIFHRF